MSEPIQTPRGTIIQTGKVSCKLVWNPGFGPRTTERYSRAQRFVDSEVLRLSSAYVPIKTSMLQKSGILGTVIGSGEVQWVAPYSQGPSTTTPLTPAAMTPSGGAHWF